MIIFTNHAKRKIAQRKLKKTWVEKTTKNPEFVRKGYGNRKLAYRKIGKMYLKVVFVEEEADLIVLTAHFEKGVKLPS